MLSTVGMGARGGGKEEKREGRGDDSWKRACNGGGG